MSKISEEKARKEEAYKEEVEKEIAETPPLRSREPEYWDASGYETGAFPVIKK